MDEKKRLLQTGVFKNESDIVLFLLVRQIGHRTGPVGSWTLKEELDSMGKMCIRDRHRGTAIHL